MHHFGRWTPALAILALCAAPAWAAEEKMVPGEGAIEVMLLRQKSVQEDLKLSPGEAEKIHAFTTQQHKKAEAIHASAASEHAEKYRELSRQNERFVADVLEPAQLARLHQIMLQRTGLLEVTQPKVAAALNLTDEQKEKAKALQHEAHREWVDLHHSTSREERHAKMEELRKKSRERLMGLLTDEQEAKLKELSGPPFEGKIHYHGGPDSK